MTKRSVALVILLSIITCGLYSIYWFYVTAKELNLVETTEQPLMNYFGAILLGIITCGIFSIFWAYKFFKKIDKLTNSSNAALKTILLVFGLGVVSMAITQDQMNDKKD